MLYTRIRSYHKGHLVAEHAYAGSDNEKAIERFYNEYPEHKNCTIKADLIDSDDKNPNIQRWFKAARAVDCVHFFS